MAKQAGGQLGGKATIGSVIGLTVGLVIRAATRVAARSATAIGEEIIKWDKEALDTLFNKTIKYSIVNNYIFAISKLYVQ